jgi:glycosyltransferase involved in cell wall biosynthesis
MVPNKRIEDIIFLAEMYKRNIDSQYRFVFVGRTDGIPNYYAAVRALIVRLEMLPERFLFTGQVNDWELAAYYRSASVYLSLSEHEGFCVPVLEAMAAGVPVFASDSSAVGETLGGAGVTWSPKGSGVCVRAARPAGLRSAHARAGRRPAVPAPRGLQRGAPARAPGGDYWGQTLLRTIGLLNSV